MGAAAYNRGSRIARREADAQLARAVNRADRAQGGGCAIGARCEPSGSPGALERELRRARRCLAAERLGRERLRERLTACEQQYELAVGLLCKLAFPADKP